MSTLPLPPAASAAAGPAAPVYTPVARLLHWVMALLLIGLVGLGLYMHELPLSPRKLQLYSWHKWAGVTAFVLVLVRLAWRLRHPAPPLPDAMGALARRAAGAAHVLLYVLMVAIPLSGWLMSSAKGVQTVWFGVLPIPDLVGRSEPLGNLLRDVHEALNIGLMALVALHVAAAIKHRFVDRDDVLARMLPGRRRPQVGIATAGDTGPAVAGTSATSTPAPASPPRNS